MDVYTLHFMTCDDDAGQQIFQGISLIQVQRYAQFWKLVDYMRCVLDVPGWHGLPDLTLPAIQWSVTEGRSGGVIPSDVRRVWISDCCMFRICRGRLGATAQLTQSYTKMADAFKRKGYDVQAMPRI